METLLPDIIEQAREALLAILTLLLVALVEAVRRWVNARTDTETQCKVRSVIAMLVLAAEQVFPAGEGDARGTEKLEWVLRLAQKQYGIDPETAQPAIEAAVKALSR
jgi:hypothetical protein